MGFLNILRFIFYALPTIVSTLFASLRRKKTSSGREWLEADTNFGPVKDEHELLECKVISGKIPSELEGGQFVRNGPNPKFKPVGNYHWFDGDGMLHGLNISNGKPYYTNKWVRTERYLYEEKHQRPMFLTLGQLTSVDALLNIVSDTFFSFFHKDRPLHRGTSNTSIQYHSGKLLSLVENDAPWVIKMPRLESVERLEYVKNDSFTAHPKVDEITGEMIWFGYKFIEGPYCLYHVTDREGRLAETVPITLEKPSMMHDFAVSENYSIILDLPLTFDKKRIAQGLPGVLFEHDRKARFGILPRHAKSESEITWFETDPFYMYHTANAWEENDEIVLVGCKDLCGGLFGCLRKGRLSSCNPHTLGSTLTLTEWRFNLKTLEMSERNILEKASEKLIIEFPVVHPVLTGRKTEYTYCAIFEEKAEMPRMVGVLKVNIKTGAYKKIYHGASRFGGECFFAPRKETLDVTEEDDGFLMTYVHDETKKTSPEWVVYDAKTMDPEPLCRVEVPARIPYGFHGKFMSRSQVENQRV